MKEQKWTYKKSIARAKRVLERWDRITVETVQALYEEKEQLAAQKGQDKDEWEDDFVPSWKHYCMVLNMTDFLKGALNTWDAHRKFIARMEEEARAKKAKRRKA